MPAGVEKPKPPTVPAPSGGVRKVGMGEILQNQSERQAPSIQARPQANISSVLPNYNRPIPPAKVTSETLAEKMSSGKQYPVTSEKQQTPNQPKPVLPDKAGQIVQKHIDEKLHDLEYRIKNKNN